MALEGVASVAVVGVGRIGAPLVARLVAAGHEVVGTDIRLERRSEVEAAGARWAPDLAGAVADAEVVLTVMPGGPELEDLVLGGGQLLSQLAEGAIWIDLTSASVELGQDCARAAAEQGIAHLEAPIGGGVDGMRDGTLTLYVGGEAGVLATAEPVLRTFATTIHHAGDHGMGYLTKLLINLLWFGQAALTTEVMLLAQNHGQSPGHLREILRGSAGDSAFAERHLPALLAGDYLADFGLDRCVEELDSVERTAARADVPHPVTAAVAALHRSALHRYGPVDGELMAAAWLEEQAGTRLHDRPPPK
ncbi:NAD(P)-dependent oxidoreductase [Kribbella sp. ALI-6-A]|uniref:NAD(P)-dependent oxidoreductase n=1 Tax=Kribbella sp. ALI-6-A TaxID=1933817 RepID=UPI0009FC0332|nr:NAD(P)-dependent oxidoreductase [Kribbella sp. ALI-6-A]